MEKMKISYINKTFQSESLRLIELSNAIIEQYEQQDYDLTLRQLYYQLVSRGYIENTEKSYKRIGDIINNARLAGLVSWKSITDRTRNMRKNAHWDSPEEIIQTAINQYKINSRQDQQNYIECWIEKQALETILEKVCIELDVSYFACRGYVSSSELWSAAYDRFNQSGKDNYIIYLGDHDPSGIDMTRDIIDRMELFGAKVQVIRLALNIDQVQSYKPPENPAKTTDSRFKSYIKKYGSSSWELDALEPSTISVLVEQKINELTDLKKRRAMLNLQEGQRKAMKKKLLK